MTRIVRIVPWAAGLAAMLVGASASAQQQTACLAACEEEASIDFTLRGGERDILSFGRFTPRSAVDDDAGGFEAEISGYGVALHGGVATSDPGATGLDSLNLGAAYAIGPVTFGGEVTLGLAEGERDAAGLGVDWRPVQGLTLGGALSLADQSGTVTTPERDVSAGVRVRLDF